MYDIEEDREAWALMRRRWRDQEAVRSSCGDPDHKGCSVCGGDMQHNPETEFTCDCIGCTASVFLEMTWYVGGYDLRDSEAKERLAADHGWLVIDGQHFCCRECAGKAGYVPPTDVKEIEQ